MKNCLLLLPYIATVALGGGTWVDTSFVPPSLGFENPLMVYLPEGYDPGGSIDYPVIYWLHGWGQHYDHYQAMHLTVMDSLIGSGMITPMILVKAEGWCEPYNGSMWANSELYGAYEDYVAGDLIAFTDSTFRTIADPLCRSISGHSMGGTGAMDIGFRHIDLYRAIAAFAATPDFQVGMGLIAPLVVGESPESSPPYSYDWGNGYYTNALFLYSGGYSPNLSAPDSVDFLLDPYGSIVDSVFARWGEHNPAHMAKTLVPDPDICLFFCCGTNDKGLTFTCNSSFADTLTAIGFDHLFYIDGGAHSLTQARFMAGVLFLDSCMYETGIVEATLPPVPGLMESAFPNPFGSSTTIGFSLPSDGPVNLQVFDISGRLVESLIDEVLPAGEHSVVLDGSYLMPGIYFVRLETHTGTVVERCMRL